MAYSAASRPVNSQRLESYRVLIVLAYLAVAVWYLTWRLGTFHPEAKAFSIVLYIAEIFGFATAMLHVFMTERLTVREAPAPEQGLTVDVFIPTINEPVSIVRRTALAALAMDYPHRTWILDDGNRAEMRRMAEQLGCVYISRTENSHAKAGNLNYALSRSDADIIVTFDADHAPNKHFLTKTLGYFRDKTVAFVQTPQDFYNLDSYQHRWDSKKRVWTEQSLFFRVIQRGKDYWNAAFFCGSCAALRRSALADVGGFATGTVTEDLHTSLRLHKAGYRSVYHAEPLAYGIAAAQIEPFLSQRVRWGQGAMQVWRKEGVLFARGLTLPQRICYLASVITYFDGWQKVIFYTAPAIVLLFGLMPIQAGTTEFLMHFVPYLVLSFWMFEEMGRGYGSSWHIEQYNMTRFAAFAWSTLGLFRNKLKFHVTSKSFEALWHISPALLPQLAVFFLNAVALPVGLMFYFFGGGSVTSDSLLANCIWAGINGALAWSVLLFTMRRATYRRKDYRFPIPLAMHLRNVSSGMEMQGLAANISSTGFRIREDETFVTRANDTIEGILFLPDGPLAFEARVKSEVKGTSRTTRAEKNIGCAFSWMDQASQDRLDMFLYGSDWQWRLNDLSERQPTLLESWFTSRKTEDETEIQAWEAPKINYALPYLESDTRGGWRLALPRPMLEQAIPVLANAGKRVA